MELIINTEDNNGVFYFDGNLGEKVWEPTPITRFRFKKPTTNDWIKDKLTANHPMTGIVFEGIPYIGTNDGFICTPEKKIQRIPDIIVDTEIFIEQYPFSNISEKYSFETFKKEGFESLNFNNKPLVQKMFEIDKIFHKVALQTNNLDRYINNYLAIRGFVVNKNCDVGTNTLYDGHLLGITETNTGRIINDLTPLVLYQISGFRAAFVPTGYPPVALTKTIIENGIEKKINAYCVDYRSLWDLTGQGRFVEGICPRDGSGYAPAKFATDGNIIAISHGDHPFYELDILKQTKNGIQEKIKSIELDPNKTPHKLLIREGMVFGDYGNVIRNFSTEENLFNPYDGEITSIADSGLCTVLLDKKTLIYDTFNSKQLDSLKGHHIFLSATPQ